MRTALQRSRGGRDGTLEDLRWELDGALYKCGCMYHALQLLWVRIPVTRVYQGPIATRMSEKHICFLDPLFVRAKVWGALMQHAGRLSYVILYLLPYSPRLDCRADIIK